MHAWRNLNERLQSEERRRSQIGDFLTVFADTLREDSTAGAMGKLASYIARLVAAESVCIYELKEGELLPCGVEGNYPLYSGRRQPWVDNASLLERLRRERICPGQGVIGLAAVNQQAELIEHPSGDPRFSEYAAETDLQSVMIVPLLRDKETTGVVCAVNSRAGAFSLMDFDQLGFIATQLVVAQQLFGIYTEARRRQRIDQELEFARHLQSSLLPESVPAWDQFAVHAMTRSAKEVNGDFYDFVEIDEDRLLIVIGDACGKGVPACMLTSMTRSFIRSSVGHFTDLASFLAEVNANLYRDSDAERFVTLGCCLLDRKHSVVEYSRSGHTDLISFVRGHIRRMSPAGSALGILPNEFASFDTVCFEFQPGMSLLLFSDGLSEALNGEGEEFGTDRLQECFMQSCLNREAPQKTLNRLMQKVDAYAVEQHDDQTMILIRHI